MSKKATVLPDLSNLPKEKRQPPQDMGK